MKKRILLMCVSTILVIGLVSCGNSQTDQGNKTGGESDLEESGTMMGSQEAKVRFKVGTTTAPDGHYVKGLMEMQSKLEEYSDGEMTLDIYPNSQLGNERDMMENVGMGVQEMCLISTGPISNFVSDFAVLDLPYIFENEQEAYNILDGEIGEELINQLKPQGIIGLGFWENGFRELTNDKKDIVTPEDLKGMKIRTMENNVHMTTYNTLGAIATPMAWSEIFTALQQGTVDGQENPIAIIESAKVYEVQSKISMIGLFYSPCVLMINDSVFNELTAEQQEIFKKAADEAKDFQRAYSQNYNDEAIAKMEAQGITVSKVDIALWKEAVAPVYDKLDSLGLNKELVDKIVNN